MLYPQLMFYYELSFIYWDLMKTFPPYSIKTKIGITALTALIYYLSNPRPFSIFDHSLKIAECLLNGHLGLDINNPPNINEFIPLNNLYYSAFPLGSVLTMIPIAILKSLHIIDSLPSRTLSAILAMLITTFLFLIEKSYKVSPLKSFLLPLSIMFGTWLWVNQTFAGSWQLALSFSMLGQLGAIYFTAFNKRPLAANIFFCLAFGNRTECILLAPIFIYLLNFIKTKEKTRSLLYKNTFIFCLLPFALGVSTLWYNFERFGTITDFGYSRIPGVLEEPWYAHGIFSIYYIKNQAWDMLLKPWDRIQNFPYFAPNPFGGSILISSPFILLAFRSGYKDKALKLCSYLCILTLSLPLLMHGNSGGWQFAYRYATILLPWIYISLLETDTKKTTPTEILLYSYSFLLNAYAIYCFHWAFDSGQITAN